MITTSQQPIRQADQTAGAPNPPKTCVNSRNYLKDPLHPMTRSHLMNNSFGIGFTKKTYNTTLISKCRIAATKEIIGKCRYYNKELVPSLFREAD